MKSIPHNKAYKITKDGTIFSKRFNRPMKSFTDRAGYVRVGLSVADGTKTKTKYYLVHRLVAETYIRNPKGLPIINHKDNNPSNNNVSNLEWVTYKENTHWVLKTNCICPKCGTRFIPAHFYKKSLKRKTLTT